MGKITDAYIKELKYLNNLSSEKDFIEKETSKALELIKRFSPVGNQFVYGARFPDLKYFYTSPSVEKVLGYPPNYFQSPDDFFGLVHEADLPTVLKATFKSLSLGKDVQQIKPFENIFHMDFRIRKKNGEWIRVQRQTGLLTKTTEGKLFSTFAIVTDITHIKESDKIILKMTGPEIPGFKFEINDNSKSKFTKQEQKIIEKLIYGKSSREIAEELNISVETVSTHRKNIMKKSERKNSADLVAWILKNGL